MAVTIQTNAHQFSTNNIKNYSLMMGGLNVTHDVLKQYDPLIGGYYRLFMVRKPLWLQRYFETTTGTSKFDAFKHILEYGNVGVSGLNNLQMEFDQIKGGYAGKQFEIPKVATDDTNSFTVKVFEFSGSPVREILHTWINGISDENSGFAHYNGLIASGQVAYSQANQTAEFIYVVTDRTGMKVEYACQFCNCIPKSVPTDHFNSEAGEHNYAQFDVEFTCTKYTGVDVNEKAAILLRNNQIMVNSLEFFSGLTSTSTPELVQATGYNPETDKLTNQNEISYRASIKNDTGKVNTSNWKLATPSFTAYANSKQ